MTHASLFSGIGAAEIAASWMGWENLFHVEINPFCRRVLEYHFPNSQSFTDVTTTDFRPFRGKLGVLSGGFPCQPYSGAGLRLGTDDERHLWPEMLRAVRESAPLYVVGENVRGLVTWCGGLVFDEVCADLESEGYDVVPFLLPAAGVGAVHERYRVFIVARKRTDPDADGERLERWDSPGAGQGSAAAPVGVETPHLYRGRSPRELEHAICSGNDGLSERLDGIAFSEWWKETLKAYGNSIVPQLIHQIFKAIQQVEEQK